MIYAKKKHWENGNDSNKTCGITWSENRSGFTDLPGALPLSIKLQLEDKDGIVDIFPADEKVADHIWYIFTKQSAPPAGDDSACVQPTLELIRGRLNFQELAT